MKTIKQHLESIADTELREAALRNMVNHGLEVASEEQAILSGIDWIETEEGAEFWDAICDFYEYGGEPTYQQFKHLIR